MMQKEKGRTIADHMTERFTIYLREQEKSASTIELYKRSFTALCKFVGERPFTKSVLLEWKESLMQKYAAISVNTMLAGINTFLRFMGWEDFKLKPLKRQRALFCQEDKELTREEYMSLVKAAERSGDERLCLVLQTICSTGIRVSELQFVTVEAVKTGRAVVNCKGKMRTIFIPKKLRRILIGYAGKYKIASGSIFITKSGKPLDRSNIWRSMKALCEKAGVTAEKVFPHNLRHLFARIYYTLERDLFRLADILGHANVNTTRIYTMESGLVHARQIEHMQLTIT